MSMKISHNCKYIMCMCAEGCYLVAYYSDNERIPAPLY